MESSNQDQSNISYISNCAIKCIIPRKHSTFYYALRIIAIIKVINFVCTDKKFIAVPNLHLLRKK